MFANFAASPGDPILSLQQTYAEDPRSDKVNLSIGIYHDEAGRVPQLKSVKRAQARLRSIDAPCVYQPMAGAANYRQAVQTLLFGAGHTKVTAGHVATIQTVGGSGALKVGSDLLRRHFPDAEVWISNPTWDNHAAIFEGSGFPVKRYTYFDSQTQGVDFEAMSACLRTLRRGSIVLFHPCCHNPTGADLTNAQWDRIISIVTSRGLLPFLDIAYQGFGSGVEEDCYAIRAMADADVSFLVSSSFSKTFSLYGERCGALSIVCASADEAARALSQSELAVRRNYSSPPTHGGQLVATVLLDAELKALWIREVDAMRERIAEMRRQLHDAMRVVQPGGNFRYLLKQRGMFAYTGLSADQVRALRTNSGIYLVDSGRLCIAGLNTGNIQRVAVALAAMTLQHAA
ncbi:aromatic amino acid transaminase [Noviherbaspirillum suwonense]|uniref:Aromatic-amino-acid transaminase n=1 Tax=Noviherbaspirillum suwonense TaxID=1224511 RepID=A0ABY1QQB0_9BURK|nr:amino acid aminotransferase [Noviherbaspirillum suwonense]SMP77207.1 aromatic-amino-acid transaminase [Noviherbaspirillum suwonense]